MSSIRSGLVRSYTSLCRRYSNKIVFARPSILRICRKRFVTFTLTSGCGVAWLLTKGIQVEAKEIDDKTIITEADHLYAIGDDPRHLYDYLIKYKDSKNVEILWRLARATRDLSLKGNVSAEEKKALVYDAFETSKRALETDEQNWAAHKWFAITIGDVGDYEGTKIKVSNAYVIRDHLERALRLNPNDATTAHAIGIWCRTFAELPWYQQKIASLLFGTPPTSTYDEAIEMFERAEKIDPNFYSVNLLELGHCYAMIGNTKRAMLNLDKAANYPAANEEDKQAVERAKKLLEELITKAKH